MTLGLTAQQKVPVLILNVYLLQSVQIGYDIGPFEGVTSD